MIASAGGELSFLLFLLTLSTSRPSICGDNEWSNSLGTKQKALGVGKGPWRQSRPGSHKRKFFVMNQLSENSSALTREEKDTESNVVVWWKPKGSGHVNEFSEGLSESLLRTPFVRMSLH